ncbi:MAG: ATP-binding protein [Flavobacteriia bacterium]|nr:ATP-binding protein [Flavobacteriia bacterium]
MIHRIIEHKILEMSTKYPIVAITGPRQAGKTTLCKLVFPTYRYVSLETPDILEFAQKDPRGFLAQYDKNVIFDEIQNVPQLFSYIQTIVDESGLTGQFILTGSQNFLMLEKITQSLAGRVYIYHLLPFSQEEIKTKYEISLNETILKGGYPRIYDKNISPEDYFPSYLQTYIERDMRSIFNIKDLPNFISFIKICAARVGQLFNASSIANELGVDHKTIQSWLYLLETSFILYRLQPWHVNFNKRIVKTPKIYFYDTGLVCHLLGITKESDLDIHFIKGAIFENYIITELVKQTWNKGKSSRHYFWRDNTGNEIDLLIDKGIELEFIEIKSAQTIKQDFFKNLTKVEKLATNYKVKKNIIFGGDESRTQFETKILTWENLGEIE